MGVTYVSDHLRQTDSTTRWPSKTGDSDQCSFFNGCTTNAFQFTVRSVVPGDYPALETVVKNVVKEKQQFERLVVSKEKLLEMFHVSTFFSGVNGILHLILLYLCIVQQIQGTSHQDQNP